MPRRPPLLRRRSQRLALALLALATAWPLPSPAQSPPDPSPFAPTLTDPRNATRFRSEPQPARRAAQAPLPPLPSGAGETGFDSTGAKKKKAKRKPGDPKPLPPPPPLPPGPPQFAGGHTIAQQIPARAPYADAYKPPNAPPRRPPVVEKDAFEPLGIRAGTFLLKPSIDVTRGFDSNPGRSSNAKSSGFTLVEPALKVQSEWSRNDYRFDLRGSYSMYDSLPSSDRPLVDAKSNLRLDVSRDTNINLESRFLLSTDYPGSPNLPVDIAKLPIFTTYGSSVGLTQRFNRLELTAKASADRTSYQDSKLTDGTTSSNHDRDFDQYGGSLRASYEITPGIRPFAEISADTRQHDLQFDRNGFQRDSRGITPKVGTTFEAGRKLTGEISVGYLLRRYDDPNLLDLRGVVFDAALKYEVSGLTTATLTGSSRADEIVVSGVSGVLRRDVGIQVDHALRRWLIWTVRAGYGFDDYVTEPCSCTAGLARADKRMSLGSAITYKLNRDFWLKGEYRYDRLRSNQPGVDYDANVFLIGLKLQR